MDLFNNPMIDAAKKSMTPEQLEEYKKIGEYMYNNINYKIVEEGSKVAEPTSRNIIFYAEESLKAGGDPHDLSENELYQLIEKYGEKWYERFNLQENEVPRLASQIITPERILSDALEKSKKLCRQQRRQVERKINKERKRLNNKK